MTELSILIATRNRAPILRETLEAMAHLKREGLSVEWVIVNNGSVDDTESVLNAFTRRLPLRRLFAPDAGKAFALNHALSQANLGEIVVFTDDDITPCESWLQVIVDACRRWPERHVFGGPIEPKWPLGLAIPLWARHEIIQSLAFARHELSAEEAEYQPDVDPFGGNFWVRREALHGVRFLERIGAREKRQRLGEDTQLHRQLRRRGQAPIYIPEARVQHRIQPSRVTEGALYRRALGGGLGVVYVRGLPDESTFQRARARWCFERVRAIGRALKELPHVTSLSKDDRIVHTARIIWSLAEHAQALRLSLTPDAALEHLVTSGPESTPSNESGVRHRAASGGASSPASTA